MRVCLRSVMGSVLLLAVAACSGGSVRATGSSLDEVVKLVTSSTRQVDNALIYQSDEIARVADRAGTTGEAVRAAAGQLDSQTSVPQNVARAVSGADAEEAAEVVEIACSVYDLSQWNTMTATQKEAFVRSQQPGTAGRSVGFVSSVVEAADALGGSDGTAVAATLARLSICQAAGFVGE